jgi:putative spermidine/putrescine transport system ATP-binding protein
MQVELKRIQQEVGITFVYVTHDQEEALTMSDRIAVFNEGRIEQIGSPADVYERPANEFVAGFVGVSNVLEREGRRFTIRPERIRFGDSGEPGVVQSVVYAGPVTRYLVQLERGGMVTVVRQNDAEPHTVAEGQSVTVTWRPEDTFAIEGRRKEEG